MNIKNLLIVFITLFLLIGCYPLVNKITYIKPDIKNKGFILKENLYIYVGYKASYASKYFVANFKPKQGFEKDYIGILSKGTKIRILNVVEKQNTINGTYYFYNSIVTTEGKYKDFSVDISYVFEKEIDREKYWEEVKE